MAGLTGKQEAFANAIVAGASPLEAYRAAGYSQRMAPVKQSIEAQKIMRKPNVALVIENARAEAARNALWSRETAIERLQRVNDVSYSLIDNTGPHGRLERSAVQAFMESADRLNALCGVGGCDAEDAPVFYFDVGEEAEVRAVAVSVRGRGGPPKQ
ncbi:terminase small subunit [Adlercreutzia caecimuris]|uniref:terminase small subunit n=1 Tax=Adlercreutzia caecimuris TaxID=671266 RepID=UPI00272DC416|nr:terminase small subunit [Adlercreutzia caecimuris]